MLTNSAAIARVFEGDFPAFDALPIDVEVELIAAAKGGDKPAYLRLLDAYIPGLRSLAARETARTSGLVDVEETRANVLLAFTEAIHAARPGERVAPQIDPAARQVGDDYHLVGALTVPARTRSRYMAAIRAAKANGTRAEDEAAELGVARDTFYSIRTALTFDSLERVLDEQTRRLMAAGASESSAASQGASVEPVYVERGIASAESRHMARAALSAIADDLVATAIVRTAYGFEDYDEVPDAEVAHRLGLTRPTVQRKRTKALDTMHEAICADASPEPRCGREHVEAGE